VLKMIIKRLMLPLWNEMRYSAAMENPLLLGGAIAAFNVRQFERLGCLADAEFKVFSQWGEDGIIEWLVSRLPEIPQSFIEFGVEDYMEANTRFLLRNRNWRGLILDGSDKNMKRVRNSNIYWMHALTARSEFITCKNINHIISESGFSGDLGILSIDIDGNDYWVWKEINSVNPWIVIVEYNAVFGNERPLTIPYDELFQRTKAHASNLYFGASITAFDHLAKARGYTLLGSNRAGCNAFFLRNDLLARVDGAIIDRTPHPSLFRDSHTADGVRNYIGGVARREVISRMPVIDVATSQELSLGDASELYSDRWKSLMG